MMIKEDDLVTWTGKRLGPLPPGPLPSAAKGGAEEETLIVDTLGEPEPPKKRPKASGFGNFSGW